MRLAFFWVTLSLALGWSVALAQQSPDTSVGKPVGDAIGHPPPLPGPPPIPEPPAKTAPPPAAAAAPQAGEPAPKGNTGAPAGTPPTPYSTGPLPTSSGGPGLNKVAPDGVSTRTVKAVPCGTSARETDGSTTCVGIPDQSARDQSPRRRRR
jgi:hypothetical protein